MEVTPSLPKNVETHIDLVRETGILALYACRFPMARKIRDALCACQNIIINNRTTGEKYPA